MEMETFNDVVLDVADDNSEDVIFLEKLEEETHNSGYPFGTAPASPSWLIKWAKKHPESARCYTAAVLILFIWAVVIAAVFSSRSGSTAAAVSGIASNYATQLENLTRIRTIEQAFQYRAAHIEFEWVAGFGSGAYLTYDYNSDIMVRFVNSTETKVLLPFDKIFGYNGERLVVNGVELSFDNKFLMIRTNIVTGKRWRHSNEAFFYIADLATYKITFLSEKSLLDAQWNPKSHDILYSQKQDLFLFKMATSEHIRITNDAESSKLLVFNGIADWVYEEEIFESARATWWSPSGDKFAFVKFDDTALKIYEYPIFHLARDTMASKMDKQVYPDILQITYPRPGTPNPTALLFVVDLAVDGNFTIKPLEIPGFDETEINKEYLIYDVSWTPSGSSLLTRVTNRVQSQQHILLYNLYGDDSSVESYVPIIARNESAGIGWFEKGPDLIFVDEFNYLDVVPEGDFKHIACFELQAQKPKLFWTAGTFQVTDLYGLAKVNGKPHQVFFQATRVEGVYEGNSSQRHVWSVGADTVNSPTKWSQLGDGFYGASLSLGGEFLVVDYSGPSVPKQILISTADGSASNSRVILDNADLHARLKDLTLPISEIASVPIPGTKVNATLRITWPLGFSKDRVNTYPVMVEVYGGPNSQKVDSRWSIGLGAYFASNFHEGTPSPELAKLMARNSTLANLGKSLLGASKQPPFIYILMDVRGTGFKGIDYASCVKAHLGEFEPDDVISVTREFVNTRPYVNADKVAIWGWSYGGYLTSKIVERQNLDPVFSVAVAVAPVTDWKFYDTVYTERYMGTLNENTVRYQNASMHTTGFEKTRYLLMHGLADDNVHYQHAAVLETELQLLEHPNVFKAHTVPDNDHGMSRTFGSRQFIYKMLSDWIVDAFQEVDRTEWALYGYGAGTDYAHGLVNGVLQS